MSPEVPGDLARVAESLRNEIQRKSNTLKRVLEEQIKENARTADRRHRELTQRCDRADEQLARTADAQEELGRRIDEELGGARRAIERLTADVRVFEGRLLREQGVQPVDLDTVPVEWARLVTQVREAEQIRSGILAEEARAAHRRLLREYAELRDLTAQSRSCAFDAGRQLAAARLGGRAFRRAARSYRTHRSRFRERDALLREQRTAVALAEEELDRDKQRREAYKARRGDDAVADLTAHIRRRVKSAVESHAFFPAWFSIELAHRPAPGRSDEWVEAAAQLVLYRITYQVTHGVQALGDAPEEEGYRAERYRAVRAALRRLAE